MAPGPPCPPRAVPFSSIAFWPPGAGKEPPPPSACFSQGRPRPGASQCSDPAHLQQPSKTGIFPLQVESGVFPVKRVPKNPVLRAPPPPHTHTGAAGTSPSGGRLRGGQLRPGHRVCCPGQAAVKHQEPGCGPHPHPLLSLEWRPAGGQKPFRKLENCFQTLTIKIETTCFVLRGEGAQGCAWWSEAA